MAEEEIAVEVASFTARFPSEQAYLDSLQDMGWSEKELRFRIAARIQQEKYLGSLFCSNSSTNPEVSARIQKAQAAFTSLHRVWRSGNLQLKTKMALFNACLLYTSDAADE